MKTYREISGFEEGDAITLLLNSCQEPTSVSIINDNLNIMLQLLPLGDRLVGIAQSHYHVGALLVVKLLTLPIIHKSSCWQLMC